MKTENRKNDLVSRCSALTGLFLERILELDRNANCILSPFSIMTLRIPTKSLSRF